MAPRRGLLLLHGTAVLAGLVYLVVATTVGSTPDANIGAGLATLWLAVLGSPWAWFLLVVDTPDDLTAGIAVASAGINLALHGYLVRRARLRDAD